MSNLTADQYSQHWISNHLWTHAKFNRHQIRYDEIAKMLVGEEFASIGCATGHEIEELQNRIGGRWTGIDFSQKQIDLAQSFFPKGKFFFCQSSEDIPQKAYDSVVCSEVLEHIQDDRTFVRHVLRAARSRAVFTVPPNLGDDPGHIRAYTLEMLQALFRNYEGEIIRGVHHWFIRVDLD